MPAIRYLDFDIAIEAVPAHAGHYRALVLRSLAGEANAEFTLPFSEVELENYILKMGRLRRGVRSLHTAEGIAARELGSKLFTAIFQPPIQECLRRSLDLATDEPNQGLRIRLHLTNAPTLIDLPWEYLYDQTFQRFLAHSVTTPIIRYLALPQRTTPLAVQPPFKALVMIASPHDQQHLDVEAEWQRVQNALSGLVQRKLLTLTRLERATLSALQHQLRQEQYHIFHFIGHGGFDQQTKQGVLMLENEVGQSRLIQGGYLGALFHDHPSLRLAILNACEGARSTQTDLFAGVAQHLILQGLPAVIAMQFEITDEAAMLLAHEFFTALAEGYPIDAALSEARKAIFAQGNDVEWGTPVLYMRSPDGHIFDLQKSDLPTPTVEESPRPLQPIQMTVDPPRIAIDPGNRVQLHVLLTNLMKIAVAYKVQLTGVPPAWVKVTPDTYVTLAPYDSRPIIVALRAPRSIKTRAGRYRVQAEAISRDTPGQTITSRLALTINTYGELKSTLEPFRAGIGTPLHLILDNQSNQTQKVALSCWDANDELIFMVPHRMLKLASEEKGKFEFYARLRQPPWFGGVQEHPFTAELQSTDGEEETFHGSIVSKGRFPGWIPFFILLLTIVLSVGLPYYEKNQELIAANETVSALNAQRATSNSVVQTVEAAITESVRQQETTNAQATANIKNIQSLATTTAIAAAKTATTIAKTITAEALAYTTNQANFAATITADASVRMTGEAHATAQIVAAATSQAATATAAAYAQMTVEAQATADTAATQQAQLAAQQAATATAVAAAAVAAAAAQTEEAARAAQAVQATQSALLTAQAPTPTPPPPPTPVRPGLVTDFESFGAWVRGDEQWGTLTQSSEQQAGGRFAAKLTYDFTNAQPDKGYVVFLRRPPLPLPDGGKGLRMQVYGDGSGNILNAWVQDSAGIVWQFTFGKITHTGWAAMGAPFDPAFGWPNSIISGGSAANPTAPFHLYALILDARPHQVLKGTVFFDEIFATDTPTRPNMSSDQAAPAQPSGGEGSSSNSANSNCGVDPPTIHAGQSATIFWTITGTKAVYLDGNGVSGVDKRTVSPAQTTTYTLHIIHNDNSATDCVMTIQVN